MKASKTLLFCGILGMTILVSGLSMPCAGKGSKDTKPVAAQDTLKPAPVADDTPIDPNTPVDSTKIKKLRKSSKK